MKYHVTFTNYRLGRAGGGMRCIACGNAVFAGERVGRIRGEGIHCLGCLDRYKIDNELKVLAP